MNRSSKALIFGVSGQDGALLAKHLLSKGYTVYGTSRDADRMDLSRLDALGITKHVKLNSVSLKDIASIQNLLKSVAPAELYHLAGQSSVGLSFQQPVETFESITLSTLNILEAIRIIHPSCRAYFACSSECFGHCPPNAPANELTPFRPVSPYGVAKAAAHWQVHSHRLAHELFVCSGILFNHESPLRPDRFVTRKIVKTACDIARGQEKRLVLGNIDIVRDWGWAPDYVDAMWRMLQLQNPQDFVIATGESHSLKSFVKLTFEQVGLDWEDHTDIDHHLFRSAEIAENYSDPTKAKKELDWSASKGFDDLVHALVCHELSELPGNQG